MNNIIDLVNACEITATNVHMRERGLDGTLANDVLLHSAQSGYFSARAKLEAAVNQQVAEIERLTATVRILQALHDEDTSTHIALQAKLSAMEAQGETVGTVGETWAHWPEKGNVPAVDWLNDTPPPVGTKLFAAPKVAQPPEGWKLVPVEPTDAMIEAGGFECAPFKSAHQVGKGVWDAMLATAPKVAPLTDEQIDEIQQTWIGKGMKGSRSFARAIEKAHGIGGQQP